MFHVFFSQDPNRISTGTAQTKSLLRPKTGKSNILISMSDMETWPAIALLRQSSRTLRWGHVQVATCLWPKAGKRSSGVWAKLADVHSAMTMLPVRNSTEDQTILLPGSVMSAKERGSTLPFSAVHSWQEIVLVGVPRFGNKVICELSRKRSNVVREILCELRGGWTRTVPRDSSSVRTQELSIPPLWIFRFWSTTLTRAGNN